MPPLNQLDMEVLVTSPLPGRDACCWEDGSVSSEISIDLFNKDEAESGSNGGSSGAGWDPESSDYTLNMLLPPNHEGVDDSDSAQDSAKMSALDYSLNVTLPRTRLSMNKPKPVSLPGETDDDSSACSCCDEPEDDCDDDESTASSVDSSKSERKVQFYPRVRIQRVTNREDMTDEYIEAVWYSRDEFKAIRKECFKTIRLLTDGEYFDEDEGKYCARGLEYKVPTLYKERQRNKSAIRHAIFEEQENQWDSDCENPVILAQISLEKSATCVSDAIVRAALDEHAVEEYLQQED